MMDQEMKDQQGIITEDSTTTDLVVGTTETVIVLVTESAESDDQRVGEEEEDVDDDDADAGADVDADADGGVQKSKETDQFETTSKEVSVDKLKANVVVEEPAETQTCVIDVKCSNVGKLEGDNINCDIVEKVCRICHLSADPPTETSDMIQLGCGCKDELGIAHRHCAETWFKLKGNRCCEICGEVAKNITGMWDDRFMEDWNDRRSVGSNSLDRRWGFWRGQPFCNFLMACLVMAFVLPWFFRVNLF